MIGRHSSSSRIKMDIFPVSIPEAAILGLMGDAFIIFGLSMTEDVMAEARKKNLSAIILAEQFLNKRRLHRICNNLQCCRSDATVTDFLVCGKCTGTFWCSHSCFSANKATHSTWCPGILVHNQMRLDKEIGPLRYDLLMSSPPL